MAIFRAPRQDKEEPQPQEEANYYEAENTVADQERELLDQRQQDFGEPTTKRQTPERNQGEAKDLSYYQPSGQTGSAKLAASGGIMKNRAAQAAALLGLPVILVLGLLFLSMNAGLTLAHIKNTVVATRMGTMQVKLNSRLSHVRTTGLGSSQSVKNWPNYERGSLGSRFLGIPPERVWSNLFDQGFELEYSRRPTLTGGLTRKLTTVIDADGNRLEIRNKTAINALRELDNRAFSQNQALNRRTINLLAKQTKLPFVRFRLEINRVKSGYYNRAGLKVLRQDMRKSFLSSKKSIMPARLKNSNLFNQGLANQAEADLVAGLDRQAITENTSERAKKAQRWSSVASKISLSVAILMFVCIIRDIASIVRDASKMKVLGPMDNSTTLVTTVSQAKAGDMAGEISSELSSKYDGFAASSTYRYALGKDISSAIGVEGQDFSGLFDAKMVFGLMNISQVLSLAKYLNPGRIINALMGKLLGFLSGLWGVGWLIDQIKKQAEAIFDKMCRVALNPVVPWVIMAAEIAVNLVGAVVTGGGSAGAWAVLKATLTSVFSRHGAKWLVAGVAFDVLLHVFIIPSIVATASGADTTMLDGEGARNYATTDYGTHYLKEGQALREGGSKTPVQNAVVETNAYLAKQRQEYANQGLASNLFNTNNPHSVVSQMAAAGHQKKSWLGQTLARIGSLFNFNLLRPVKAVSNDDLAGLLYPGQTHIIDFSQAEVEGLGDFDHVQNTVYVESKLGELKEKYGSCLSVNVTDFMLEQAGIKDEQDNDYYKPMCDEPEARRYKIYYQDCNHVVVMSLEGTNSSPMFSSFCDTLIDSPESEAEETASQPQTTAVSSADWLQLPAAVEDKEAEVDPVIASWRQLWLIA